MQRVMVIGCPGAGKSWLSTRIAQALALPLVSLDAEFWHPGWVQPAHQDWLERVDTLSAAPRWVMDGNYAGTLEVRMPRADAVIFLDLPRWRYMLNLLLRTLANLGVTREGMAAACPERLDMTFLVGAWRFRGIIRTRTLAAMATLRPDQTGMILRTRAEITAFAMGFPQSLTRVES